jgi:hypothetical protein
MNVSHSIASFPTQPVHQHLARLFFRKNLSQSTQLFHQPTKRSKQRRSDVATYVWMRPIQQVNSGLHDLRRILELTNFRWLPGHVEARGAAVQQNECVDRMLVHGSGIVEKDRCCNILDICAWSTGCICTGSFCAIAH